MVALAVFLIAGFVSILERRFDQGELYPHYASYRSDPLGTSVLYESLERIAGVTVSRNRAHLNVVGNLDADTTLLLLGFPRDEIDSLRAPDDSPVMAAVKAGGRLVIAVNPQQVPKAFRRESASEEKDWLERRRRLIEERNRERRGEDAEDKKDVEEREKKEKAEKEALEDEMDRALGKKLTELLGFELEAPDFTRPEEGWETAAGTDLADAAAVDLPDWRSQYRFKTDEDEPWREILLVKDRPVVIERDFGEGTIVLATDSHFLSNENLHLGAQPELILWVLGEKPKIVFDETIHGTVETGGAMKLMRRYRIHGVFFGLIVFFVLWIWRGAVPLVPGSEESERGLIDGSGTVVGEESGSGLVRLLRRSIPAGGLIEQCVAIWMSSRQGSVAPAVEEKIGVVVATQRAQAKTYPPADAYRAIADLVRKR